MKNLVQVQVLPIKTFLLERKEKIANLDYYDKRYQHSKNIRNFKFQKLMAKNKLDYEQPFNNKQYRMNSLPIKKLTQPPCSKSFDKKQTRNKIKIQNLSQLSIYKDENCALSHKSKSPQVHTAQNASIVINYFPRRKSKKNTDPRWHNYFSMLKNNEINQIKLRSASILAKNASRNCDIYEQQKFQKIKKRCLTSKPIQNHSIFHKNKSQRNQNPNEISPWNTFYIERELFNNRCQQNSKIMEYDS